MPVKSSPIAELIQKRRSDVLLKRGYVALLFRFVLIVLVFWLLFSQVFMITQVKGNDMFPAMKDGDLVFAFRLQKEYAKNDVVVCDLNGKQYIGRVLAGDTDVITMDDSGTLLVNGTIQSGEIMFSTYAKEGIEYPFRVPKNHVFLLGDYRTQAEDSRDFGAVPIECVKGKVITILRRRGL